jgi:hypothetical protein
MDTRTSFSSLQARIESKQTGCPSSRGRLAFSVFSAPEREAELTSAFLLGK